MRDVCHNKNNNFKEIHEKRIPLNVPVVNITASCGLFVKNFGKTNRGQEMIIRIIINTNHYSGACVVPAENSSLRTVLLYGALILKERKKKRILRRPRCRCRDNAR